MNIRRQQGPARGNLAQVIAASLVGEGGDLISPEERARRQATLAQRQAASRQPQQVTHWAQGAAMLVDAFSDASESGRLRRAEEAATAEDQRLAAGVRGYGGSYSSGGAYRGDPVAAALFGPSGSSGIPQMPSASSPAGGARAAADGPASSALPASFLASVDRTEGGGGYDTLFGHSQRSGPFAGVQVSQMPISEVLAFSDPSGSYGQWVKGQVGRVATPMGRHQIVGSTLRRAVNELGLDPSMPFDAQTQDTVAAHLARSRVQSASTTSGKIAALRSEWEGFKHVSDAEMAQIVADLEGGGSAPAPVQVASLDPSIGLPAQNAPSPQSPAQADAVAQALINPPQAQPAAGTASESIASALVPSSAAQTQPRSQSVQVAQALFPSGPSGINPALLEAATSPYASDSTRSVAQALMQSEMQRQNQMFQQQMQERDPLRQLQIQQAQQELARGQALINVGGGQLFDPNSREWISAPGAGQGASTPDAFQTLQLRAEAAGLVPGSPEFQTFMANGGRSAEDSAAEQRIGRLTENLMATGAVLDPVEAQNLAVGMVDGRYGEGRDPITGNLQIIDKATGSVLFDGRNAQGGQGSTSAPSAIPSNPAMAPAPAPSEFGERYPNAPESFGLAGTAQRAANTIGDTVGIGAPFPDVQTTQASFDVLQESLLNDVQGAYGRQPPSWLLKRIDDLTPKAGVPWQGPGSAVVKLQALGNHLQTELQLAQESSGRDMNPERRQALEEKIIGLEAGLGRIRQAINAFGPQEQSASPPDEEQEFEEGATAINSETGERLIYRGGRWEQTQ